MQFEELVAHQERSDFEGSLLALDPGHTTGVAVFRGTELDRVDQIDTKDPGDSAVVVKNLINEVDPEVIVIEDYRVYKWRAQEHVHSQLITTQVIGMIRAVNGLRVFPAPIVVQPANVAKNFCTNAKLEEWGFYDDTIGRKHARDAVRHACYYILFGRVIK